MPNCPYCGNNPTNHTAQWFHGSMDIALAPIRRKLFFGWFGKNVINNLTDLLGWITLHGLRMLGLVRMNSDIEKVPFPRAKVLLAEAKSRGIEIWEVKPFNVSIDLYSAKINGKSKKFFGLPRPDTIDESILDWIDDKWIIKQKLTQAGLPASIGGSFSTFKPALNFFKSLGQPTVIKPRKGSRNRHTSVLVSTEEQFRDAFQVAKQLCWYVIVEEYLYGDIYRGTMINGNLVGIYGISSPKVTGDDEHSVAQLIQIHNQNLSAGMIPIDISEPNLNHLKLQNLNLDSVLPKNKTITLSPKAGVNYSGTSYDCTKQAHSQIKDMLIAAARAVGDPILGFDFIAEDITKPITDQKIGIIECNGAPFINLHYDPLYGETINAAKYVWDLMES